MTSDKRPVAASAAFTLALCLAAAPGVVITAQQTTSAYVSVLDRAGNPVNDLAPSQVTMTLDGVECTSTRLEPIVWPTRLTVLVDNGLGSAEPLVPGSLQVAPSTRTDEGTIWANALPNLREGLRRFLLEVPEGVETSLVTLAPQPRWIVRPTAERRDFWQGIDLLIPDRGYSKFLEGLAEAASRIEQDTSDAFFTLVIVATNNPDSSGGDWQRIFDRLRSQLAARPVTVHFLMLSITEQRTTDLVRSAPVGGTATGTATNAPAAGGSVASRPGLALKVTGALQTQVGLALTEATGGHFESIAVANRLLTLMPEFGRRIARSWALQSNLYRISCDNASPQAAQIAVYTSYPGSSAVVLSRDGHMP
jgi:hypothetical protein